MYSTHYLNDRQAREHLIKKIGYGKPVARFRVDRGHPNGAEIHEISDTGIITVYNERTGKLVTKLIARPQQIRRYYQERGLIAPQDIVELAYQHSIKNYNNI